MNLKLFSKKTFVIFITVCFLLLVFPVPDFAKQTCGHLMGFVYGEDGKSPLENAVVLVKGVETNKIFQSKPTGKTGDYRITDINAGVYMLGLMVGEKTYNVPGYVEVAGGRTDTLSLSTQSPSGLGETALKEQGWCCNQKSVFKGTREECINCKGAFFSTKKKADQYCGAAVLAFFKAPSGIAILISGSAAMTYGLSKLFKKYEEEISGTER